MSPVLRSAAAVVRDVMPTSAATATTAGKSLDSRIIWFLRWAGRGVRVGIALSERTRRTMDTTCSSVFDLGLPWADNEPSWEGQWEIGVAHDARRGGNYGRDGVDG